MILAVKLANPDVLATADPIGVEVSVAKPLVFIDEGLCTEVVSVEKPDVSTLNDIDTLLVKVDLVLVLTELGNVAIESSKAFDVAVVELCLDTFTLSCAKPDVSVVLFCCAETFTVADDDALKVPLRKTADATVALEDVELETTYEIALETVAYADVDVVTSLTALLLTEALPEADAPTDCETVLVKSALPLVAIIASRITLAVKEA